MAEGEGFEPPVPFQVQRFSSSRTESDGLWKLSTLLDPSMTYKVPPLSSHDWIWLVLITELLQLYYSC